MRVNRPELRERRTSEGTNLAYCPEGLEGMPGPRLASGLSDLELAQVHKAHSRLLGFTIMPTPHGLYSEMLTRMANGGKLGSAMVGVLAASAAITTVFLTRDASAVNMAAYAPLAGGMGATPWVFSTASNARAAERASQKIDQENS